MARYDIPSTYGAADTMLGRRESRNVANNTRMRRDGIGEGADIIIRHWSTDIITHRADGWTVAAVDGWHTVTTWRRVNAALPGSFRIGSAGKRGTFVYAHGYAVCPYVDGIAVNAGTGEVGILVGVTVRTLYTPADIAHVRAVEDARRAERDRKRAARIAREHPEVRPITYRADMPHAPYGAWDVPLPNPHRMGSWRAAGECARCAAERDAWRDIRRPILAADHADTDGRHDVRVIDPDTAEVYTFGRARVSDCPECIAAGPYAYGTRY